MPQSSNLGSSAALPCLSTMSMGVVGAEAQPPAAHMPPLPRGSGVAKRLRGIRSASAPSPHGVTDAGLWCLTHCRPAGPDALKFQRRCPCPHGSATCGSSERSGREPGEYRSTGHGIVVRDESHGSLIGGRRVVSRDGGGGVLPDEYEPLAAALNAAKLRCSRAGGGDGLADDSPPASWSQFAPLSGSSPSGHGSLAALFSRHVA